LELQQLSASYDTALKKIDMVKKSIKDQEKRLKDATPDKKRLHELEDAMKDAECEWGATKVTKYREKNIYSFSGVCTICPRGSR
jgi:hypothetical protein